MLLIKFCFLCTKKIYLFDKIEVDANAINRGAMNEDPEILGIFEDSCIY